jgi:hypothetical protein
MIQALGLTAADDRKSGFRLQLITDHGLRTARNFCFAKISTDAEEVWDAALPSARIWVWALLAA